LLRSLVEGVSYSLKDCLDIVESLGIEVRTVRASGGGAKSPFWRGMLANIFGCPITTLETQEGSAYGAALLAMSGTGGFSSVPEACNATIRAKDQVEPQPELTRAYAAGHRAYQALYPALKNSFRSA
jgi:xylulokinase